jgi:hypothetical protein
MAKPRMTDLSDLLGAKKPQSQQSTPEPAQAQSEGTPPKPAPVKASRRPAAKAVSTPTAAVAEPQRVTTPRMSAADMPRYLRLMRKETRITQTQADQLSRTVRTLNQARRGEGERITDNTLIRVAIGLLLERLDDLHGTTEAELFHSLGLNPAE